MAKKKNLYTPTLEEVDEIFGPGRKNATDDRLVEKYISLRESAKNRGIEFNVSLKRLRQIINTKTCQYTGRKLYFNPSTNEYNSISIHGHREYLSVERARSDEGYTDSNIIAIGQKVNTLKTDLDPIDIIRMARKLEKMGLGKKKKKK